MTIQNTKASANAMNRPGGNGVPQIILRQHLRRRERRGLREIMAVRVLPGPGDEIVQQLQRDIDQHQARKDLVDADSASSGTPGSPPRARRR